MTPTLSDDDKKDEEPAKSPGSLPGSLTEKLAFKSRFVLVFGEVDHAMARSTCERLIALAQESERRSRCWCRRPAATSNRATRSTT